MSEKASEKDIVLPEGWGSTFDGPALDPDSPLTNREAMKLRDEVRALREELEKFRKREFGMEHL